MQNKHWKKRKLKRELTQIRNILKKNLNLAILNAVFHQITLARPGFSDIKQTGRGGRRI